ncbi:MAG: hypothetical protein V1768_01785 [Patescibacteria group bacterium]|nr:hypothetical protein [Patescibacteria group bacterium]MBU1350096.1 hypothetical protein [Patescibacteria group bacterium]MBU1421134.1 hypothetical protein [Patescibacteria group bacterium]
MKQFIAFIICVIFALSIVSTANALTISPPLMEIDANPGEVIEKAIKIIAESDVEGIYYPSTANFTARGEEGEPGFLEPEETKGYSLASWIEIDNTAIGLRKNERKKIPFTIRVPENAEPGGHYGVIFFSTQPPDLTNKQTAIGVTGKLGSLILVKIAGEIKEEGRLVEFNTVNKEKFYNRLPVEFFTRFENTGNVHLKPLGEIKITRMFGKEMSKFLVNEKGGNVLPNSIRKYKSAWEKNKGSVVQDKGFFAELKNEKNNFAFGRYKAELKLVNYQGGAKIIWIIPWRILLVSIIILIVVILVLRLLVREYNKKIIREHGKNN